MSFKHVCLLTAIAIALLFRQSHSEEWNGDIPLDFKGVCSFIEFKYVGPGSITIRNMPLEVRNVPVYPDDASRPGYTHGGPIEGVTNNSYGLIMFCFGKDYKINNSIFSFSINWFATIPQERERNYTNNPGSSERGEGAALTYVTFKEFGVFPSTHDEGADDLIALTPEIRYTHIIPLKQPLFLDGSISYFHLQAHSGWDRFDYKEINHVYDLAYYVPVSLSLCFHILNAGIYYPIRVYTTSMGKEANIKDGPTFTVGLKGFFGSR